MTEKEVWDFINNGELDFEFEFDRKSGTICLCYLPKVYILYNGKEFETTFEGLMDLKFLNGKSLRDVATEIEFYG